jgi:hypothetical protein
VEKNNHKFKSLFQKSTKYFFDFFVVFIGVFLAFWLNARKEEQNKIDKQRQTLTLIYKDLNTFYISGRTENPNGFINLFKGLKDNLDSLTTIRKIPPYSYLYGDYWHLEIINSLILSGQLKELDPNIFRSLTQFNRSHQNFLAEIENYNRDYQKYITNEYDKGMEYIYVAESNELLERSKVPLKRLNSIISFAEDLVDGAKVASMQLKEELEISDE